MPALSVQREWVSNQRRQTVGGLHPFRPPGRRELWDRGESNPCLSGFNRALYQLSYSPIWVSSLTSRPWPRTVTTQDTPASYAGTMTRMVLRAFSRMRLPCWASAFELYTNGRPVSSAVTGSRPSLVTSEYLVSLLSVMWRHWESNPEGLLIYSQRRAHSPIPPYGHSGTVSRQLAAFMCSRPHYYLFARVITPHLESSHLLVQPPIGNCRS